MLGHRPHFITALANDRLGAFALQDFDAYEFHKSQLHIAWPRRNGTQSTWRPNEASAAAAAATCAYTGRGQSSQCELADDQSTSCFALVLVDSLTGQCEYVIANLDTVLAIDSKTIHQHHNLIAKAPLVVTDANLACDSLVSLIELCHTHKRHLFIEPTDVMALPHLVEALNQIDLQQPQSMGAIVCLTPNLVELNEMLQMFCRLKRNCIAGIDSELSIDKRDGSNGSANSSCTCATSFAAQSKVDQAKRAAETLLIGHLRHVRSLLVTMDKDGVLFAVRSRTGTDLFDANEFNLLSDNFGTVSTSSEPSHETDEQNGNIVFEHFPAPKVIDRPVSGSGAGDSFAAGFISGLLHNQPVAKCIAKGFEASMIALQAKDPIPIDLRKLAN